jgi:hypothetical protein
MTVHEKAAGVLDTPATAQESKRKAILGPHTMDRKEFDTLRARFARRRYVLQRVHRADNSRVTYHVTRNTQTRVFSHPHDLGSFLAVVEGLPV